MGHSSRLTRQSLIAKSRYCGNVAGQAAVEICRATESLEQRTLLAAVADFDGDLDFDANDSFLNHLIQLSGSNAQIDLFKGGSSLSAVQIRDRIAALMNLSDVDGDLDSDANDSFLIHLLQLSGTDTHVDALKGSSPLSAAQIRANVNRLAEELASLQVLIDGETQRVSNGNLTLTGRAVASSAAVDSLLAQVDLGDAVPVTVSGDGSFTFSTSLPADGTADGAHLIRFRATDSDGNISPLSTVEWQLDTQAPEVVSSADGLLRAGISELELSFDEPVAAAAFDPGNYLITVTSGPNPGSLISITDVEQNGNIARLILSGELGNASYELSADSAVTDLAGNPASPRTIRFNVEQPTRLTESSPASGEEMVALTREAVIRFDGPIDPATVTADSFYLIANSERVPGSIRVSSTERFATFFYDAPLPPSTEVRIMVNGDQITGRDGLLLDADNDGEPGGMLQSDFRTLPLNFIPGTRVFGYVYDSYNRDDDGNDIPVVGATISLDANPDVKAVTDEDGFFELGLQDLDNDGNPDGLPAPEFFVHIDGSTAVNAPNGTAYAALGKPFHSIPGRRVQLEMDGGPDVDPETPGEQFHIYLPPMAMDDVVALNPNADTSVGFGPAAQAQIRALMDERFPDDPATAAAQAQLIIDTMRVTYPAGSAQNVSGTAATRATVIPVDPNRLPAPLPPGADPELVISVQAGSEAGFNAESLNFDVPAPVVFPNLQGLEPGEKTQLVSFDHDAGRWTPVGSATVSEDGRTIETDAGVGVLAPGWHIFERFAFLFGGGADRTDDRCGKAFDDFAQSTQDLFQSLIVDMLPGGKLVQTIGKVADKVEDAYDLYTLAKSADGFEFGEKMVSTSFDLGFDLADIP
ncbi:MAG: Ig-like domain-containing protein, partial [Planctomycetaceae bacterium]|nr:Ig-like domain-containing protein [Planctomycetaceae bacterium]